VKRRLAPDSLPCPCDQGRPALKTENVLHLANSKKALSVGPEAL
jgi:hypothetical protein